MTENAARLAREIISPSKRFSVDFVIVCLFILEITIKFEKSEK